MPSSFAGAIGRAGRGVPAAPGRPRGHAYLRPEAPRAGSTLGRALGMTGWARLSGGGGYPWAGRWREAARGTGSEEGGRVGPRACGRREARGSGGAGGGARSPSPGRVTTRSRLCGGRRGFRGRGRPCHGPRGLTCSGAHARRLLCRDLPSRAGGGQGGADGADGLRARRHGQYNRHLPSVPRRGHCHAAQRSGSGWGTWRHRQYGLHRRLRWTDRAGRLCRLQGRGGEPDLAAGPRVRELRGQGRLHRPGGLRDPDGGVHDRVRPCGPAEPAAVSPNASGSPRSSQHWSVTSTKTPC